MAGQVLDFERSSALALGPGERRLTPAPPAVGYLLAAGLTGLAVLVGFAARPMIGAPNLTLLFVLPVVITAVTAGLGPAIAAALAGVLAFDFFFTRPYYSLRMASPADVWAAGLLLVIAAIVSTLAADARRRATEARAEADRAEALHQLAHQVVRTAAPSEVARAAVQALSRIFHVAAVALVETGGALQTAAASEGAQLTASDVETAAWALANRTPSRGESVPSDASGFDFWPIVRPGAPGLVLGVRRGGPAEPEQPARYVELVGAYLAAGLSPARG